VPARFLQVWGPVEGVPVLGLHGWLDNAATFDRMGPHLAAAGIRLVSIDFPGHGMSTHRSPDAVYHFTDYVYYALAVARKLGWKRFSILGHSLGAAIGIALAGTYPESVLRVVSVEALGLISKPAHAAPQTLRYARTHGGMNG
jgi:pimeloyl-ACP methyl ester carboxylesterase